jgi:hypothetical protein
MKTTNGNHDDDGKQPKDDRFDFDDNSAKTQLNLDLKYLTRAIDAMCKIWDKYTDIDPQNWLHVDTNEQYLNPDAQNASQDTTFILQSICNFVIDFVLFHNIVDYMIKLGVPNCPEEVILVMSIIFPIAFFCGEVAANGWIRSAKAGMDLNDDDIGAKFWFVFVCFFGLLLALFPSAAFAYVMNTAQAETNQSPLFIFIMAILGIVIHLMVVFGDHVVDSRVRLWAKFRHWQLQSAWRKTHRQLGQAARRVSSNNKKQAMPMELALSVQKIIDFVDHGWHPMHPLGRPPAYRFGVYSSRRHDRDRNDGTEDRDPN